MATVDQNKNIVPEDETTHPGGKPSVEEQMAQAYLPPPRDHEGLTPQGVGVFLPGHLEPRTPGVGGNVPGLGHVETTDTSYEKIAERQHALPKQDRPAKGRVQPADVAAARERASDPATHDRGVEAVKTDPRTDAPKADEKPKAKKD